MAVVARVFPRHWDGRRLLQFLTGLALIALAFAASALAAAPEAPAPATVVTTVDAPAGSALVDRVVAPDPRAAAESRSTTADDAARAADESPAADASPALTGAAAMAAGASPAAGEDSATGAGDVTAPEIASRSADGGVPPRSTDAAGAALLCHRDVPDLSGVAQRPYAGRAPPSA